MLTEAQITQFRHDGCTFPVRVMSAQAAHACREQLEAFERVNGGPLHGSLRHKSDVDPSKQVTIELQPGEMSLHHVRLVHGAPPNPSDDRRIGLAICCHRWHTKRYLSSLPMGTVNAVIRPTAARCAKAASRG